MGDERSFSSLDLDYPVTPRVRWGHGLPPHPELAAIIDARREAYAAHLRRFMTYRMELEAIGAREPTAPNGPTWVNWYMGGIDCLSLYGFVRTTAPALYLEIGSGTSTSFARRAITDGGSSTQIVSIDPEPRADIDQICDRVVRSRLEDVDLSVFAQVAPGDIVFFDGTHRTLMNSDATVFFLEVLPRLPAGVLVHVHDIFLPEDYLPDWTDRHYSEQYLLATWLLGGGRGLELEFPSWFVHTDDALRRVAEPLWDTLGLAPDEYRGCSFWMRTAAG